jgi:phage tail-like protein
MAHTALSRPATTFVIMVAVLTAVTPAAFAQDPITAARFSITVDGYEIASFSELAGITTEVEPVDPSRGAPRTRGLVQLSRALSNEDEAMAAWHEAVLNGDIISARKSVRLVAYNRAGKPVLRYHLENAWPKKLEISSLTAGASQQLLETVTIVSERIQRVSASSTE